MCWGNMNVAAMDRKRAIFMASQRDKLQIALFRENSMSSLLRFCIRTAYGVVRCVWFQQCSYCPYFQFSTTERLHQRLNYRPPVQVYTER